jgi:diacylglycerol kinase (ATP)
MTKLFVIFNPAARGEKSQRLKAFLEAKAGADVTLLPTRAPGDAQTLAADAVAAGARCVLAAGGDGTINEVVNGIGTAGVPLGILPLGTANVFSRDLRLPFRVADAWEVVNRGHTRTIDLGCADASGQRRYFVQLAGVGFDAAAIQLASWELKKKIGPLSYVIAGLRVLRQKPRMPVVFIGNGRLYGGPFTLFPQAQFDDGKLDICVMEHPSVWLALSVMRGRHTTQPGVRYFQAETYEHDGALPFELDGEFAGQTPVKFSVIPRALRVIVP